jgi:hypothetical protein
MDQAKFESEMSRARIYRKLERPDYWEGFTRGLRRAYHGAIFGTEAQHVHWLSLAADGGDESSRKRGRGYRDGLAVSNLGAEVDGAITVQATPTLPGGG